jgi:excisionase family DNA binding protein
MRQKEKAMLTRPLLTVHETAEQLKVKESTIRSWIRSGKLRAIKFGREWRVTVKDLERFLNENANFAAAAD